MTVATLIKTALRTIGAIATGETPSADESADTLATLNIMLSSWSIDGFLVYETKRESFPLVVSQASYSFGSGGDFNSARPHVIEKVNVEKDDIEYPVEILKTTQEWAGVYDKTLTSSLPSKVYASGTYPTETLYVWPVPTEANSLVIHSLKPLTSFSATSDSISLPPGYEEALIYNLAIRLAIEFGEPIDPEVKSLADKLKANIKRKNIKPIKLKSDLSGFNCGGGFDIQTGGYR